MIYLWHHAPVLVAALAGACAAFFLLGYVVARVNLYERIQAESARRKTVEDIRREQRITDLEEEREHLLMAFRAAGFHIDKAYKVRRRSE